MPQHDMPPVTNWLLYGYRIFMKWISFFLFGMGTVFLITLAFPVMGLCIHPAERFKRYARRLVSFMMRLLTIFMHLTGIVEVEADNREAYRNLNSKIIVANHPSLLDVVVLLSLIPNADCIVQGTLARTIVRSVILRLYIPNYLDFADLSEACIGSLRQGNCIIIFPEGTRTPRSGNITLKKGAARLSLLSGCGIIPVMIGGTDKYGLGKHDPWASFNHRDKYIYQLSMGKELSPAQYGEMPLPIGVRHMNRDIRFALFSGVPEFSVAARPVPEHSLEPSIEGYLPDAGVEPLRPAL